MSAEIDHDFIVPMKPADSAMLVAQSESIPKIRAEDDPTDSAMLDAAPESTPKISTEDMLEDSAVLGAKTEVSVEKNLTDSATLDAKPESISKISTGAILTNSVPEKTSGPHTDTIVAETTSPKAPDAACVITATDFIGPTAEPLRVPKVSCETTAIDLVDATTVVAKNLEVDIQPASAVSLEAGETIKHEFGETRAPQTSSMPVKPENDEESESESDETDAALSDDGTGVEDEFKDEVEAIIQGFGIPYDPSNENTPNLPAYHPSFLKVEQFCAQLLEDAAQLLKTSEYKDAKLLDLQEQAVAKQTTSCPKPRRIGMVGDSGVGKSSLINSLLDTPELALQGEDGGACTFVITEYQQAWPTQTAPFKAEIELFELEQIQKILITHFQAYFKYHFQSNKGVDQDTLQELEAHATTAFEAFRALFADHREFQSEERAHEFLSRAKLMTDSIIPHKLSTWVELLMSKDGAVHGIIHLTADTAAELGRKLEPFVKMSSTLADEEEPCPSPWPIVKLVRLVLVRLI